MSAIFKRSYFKTLCKISIVAAMPIVCFISIYMDSTPGLKVVKSWLGPFLIKAQHIQGKYINRDVNSMVIIYHTMAKNEKEFYDALSFSMDIYKWKLWDNNSEFIEYRRRRQEGNKGILYSLSIARICYIPESRMVVVAFVSADLYKNGKCFDDSPEGKFAKTKIWPMFFDLVKTGSSPKTG